MVIIASGMEAPPAGRGVGLIVGLAGQLETTLGPAGRWIFLAGAWAAVFSSLLGVWQSVPYVFADFVGMHRRAHGDRCILAIDTHGLVGIGDFGL